MALLRVIWRALLWVWQLPQNLLGLLLRLFLNGETYGYRGVRVRVSQKMKGSLSLGSTIFMSSGNAKTLDYWAHEFGHCRQSQILGPLYLPFVGLLSVLWAWWWTPKRGVSYFSFFTEKWADRLGGVNNA